MYFAGNCQVKHLGVSVNPGEGLKCQTRPDLRDNTLDDETQREGEWQAPIELGNVEGVDDIAETEELLMKVMGGHAKEFHVSGDNGDWLINYSSRRDIGD
jgi:hypothetical protein